jgi:hypothetical protein
VEDEHEPSAAAARSSMATAEHNEAIAADRMLPPVEVERAI